MISSRIELISWELPSSVARTAVKPVHNRKWMAPPRSMCCIVELWNIYPKDIEGAVVETITQI